MRNYQKTQTMLSLSDMRYSMWIFYNDKIISTLNICTTLDSDMRHFNIGAVGFQNNLTIVEGVAKRFAN